MMKDHQDINTMSDFSVQIAVFHHKTTKIFQLQAFYIKHQSIFLEGRDFLTLVWSKIQGEYETKHFLLKNNSNNFMNSFFYLIILKNKDFQGYAHAYQHDMDVQTSNGKFQLCCLELFNVHYSRLEMTAWYNHV